MCSTVETYIMDPHLCRRKNVQKYNRGTRKSIEIDTEVVIRIRTELKTVARKLCRETLKASSQPFVK